MRAALSFLIAAGLLCAPAATAQTNAVAPNAPIVGIERTPLLDGVWRVNGLGDLTLATRPNDALTGTLDGRPCHGQYEGNAFSIFCESPGRGPYLISGQAARTVRENSTARSHVFAQPARMTGQIHQSYLSSHGHTEQVATLNATRQ